MECGFFLAGVVVGVVRPAGQMPCTVCQFLGQLVLPPFESGQLLQCDARVVSCPKLASKGLDPSTIGHFLLFGQSHKVHLCSPLLRRETGVRLSLPRSTAPVWRILRMVDPSLKVNFAIIFLGAEAEFLQLNSPYLAVLCPRGDVARVDTRKSNLMVAFSEAASALTPSSSNFSWKCTSELETMIVAIIVHIRRRFNPRCHQCDNRPCVIGTLTSGPVGGF